MWMQQDMEGECRKFHQLMVKTSQVQSRIWDSATQERWTHVGNSSVYLGNDIPYTVYTVCLGLHVSTLKIFPPPLESQWIFFLPLACSFLLMECNSWVAFATLLMKIVPIFQNSIKTPFSKKPITSLYKHRCIHITMEVNLFCLSFSK